MTSDAIVRDAQGTMLFHYVIAQLFAVVSPDATGVCSLLRLMRVHERAWLGR